MRESAHCFENAAVSVPTRREPVFNVPGVVTATLLLLIVMQAARQILPAHFDDILVSNLAFVPLRLTAAVDHAGVAHSIATWTGSADPQIAARAPFAAYLLTQVSTPAIAGLLTYAMLHGGWTHVGLNGVWLLAFGTPVARRFGPRRFCALIVVAAVAGACTHWALFPFDVTPLVGASAAVSGCMGAALRFAFRSVDFGEAADEQPAVETLGGVLRNRRALSFLIAWFVSNILFGLGSVSFGLSDAPVAWQAHVGGFLAGLLLFRFFDPPRPAQVETQV